MSFIYIASPYSDTDPNVRELRYRQVCWYTIGLLAQKQWCYSPVVHNHELAVRFALPTDAGSWMQYNFAMLSAANQLHVLKLEGWNKSVGVAAELAYWKTVKGPGEVVLVDWTPSLPKSSGGFPT